jgi:hypothetical protein
MNLNEHLISCIETYRGLLKRTAEEIENYIFSYKSTPKEELPNFDAWPELVSQDERDWIRYNFLPTALRNYNAPTQVITAVKKANDILFELTDLKGFDKHLNNKKYSEKKIDVLFEAASALTMWELDKQIEQSERDIMFGGVKVKEQDDSNKEKHKKNDNPKSIKEKTKPAKQPITLRNFIETYCDLSAKIDVQSKVDLLHEYNSKKKIKLPELAHPYKTGQHKYYYADDLRNNWQQYQIKMPTLPPLKLHK